MQSTNRALSPAAQDAFKQAVQSRCGVIKRDELSALAEQYGLCADDVLPSLVPLACELARPPISEFYVGAVAEAECHDGQVRYFFGANVEFAGQALSLVVHAEQSALHNAWLGGATRILRLAISDAPCGYCRQFINELVDAKNIDVLLPERTIKFDQLLPYAFGPADLDNPSQLLHSPKLKLQVDGGIDGELKAHAEAAYVPYTGNASAAMLVTHDGERYFGRYAENAAYSPSLSPLQGAISQLHLAGKSMDKETLAEVHLLELEGKANQLEVARAVLASYDFSPRFYHHLAKCE